LHIWEALFLFCFVLFCSVLFFAYMADGTHVSIVDGLCSFCSCTQTQPSRYLLGGSRRYFSVALMHFPDVCNIRSHCVKLTSLSAVK
jgi:hypothetical protein